MHDPILEFPTQLGSGPTDRRRIAELWRTSDEFRSLCEELQLARRAERFWSHRMGPEAAERRAEFHTLGEALERELRERVAGDTK